MNTYVNADFRLNVMKVYASCLVKIRVHRDPFFDHRAERELRLSRNGMHDQAMHMKIFLDVYQIE